MASFLTPFLTVIIGVSFVTAGGVFDFFNSTDVSFQEFSNLATKFNFKFSSINETKKRFENFQAAKERLNKFHQKFKGVKFAHNQFSLMSDDEMKNYLDAQPPNHAKTVKRSVSDKTMAASSSAAAPDSFDFRDYNQVTSIKDQKRCGSCWAFASSAAIESQYLLHLNQSLDLSEQYLVDCNTIAHGCNGGWPWQTFDFISEDGIPSESSYLNYTAQQGVCMQQQSNAKKYFIKGYLSFGTNESEYASHLYNNGPAVIAFYVPAAFMSYSSGVLDFPGDICAADNIGFHAIVVVGYTKDYWIAKNSWGSWWGENGFVRFKRGQNFCEMTMEVVAPYIL